MGRIVVVALIVGVAITAWVLWRASTMGGGRRALGADSRAALDPAVRRNHLAMARWIDARLGDELVRPMIPEDEQARARALLSEFYGDEP